MIRDLLGEDGLVLHCCIVAGGRAVRRFGVCGLSGVYGCLASVSLGLRHIPGWTDLKVRSIV